MANKVYGVREVLIATYKVIDQYGYTPKGKATEETPATASIVERVIKGIEPSPEVTADLGEIKSACDHYTALFNKPFEYVGGARRGNQFDFTLGEVIGKGAVTAKQFGFITSVLPSYRRFVQREAEYVERKAVEAELGKASEWIGDPKDRLTLTATIESVKALDTIYGTSFLTKLLSEDTNHVVWFASNDPEGSYKHFGSVGDEVTFKATVKKHDEFNGIKQTVVTRCVAVA